MKIGRSPMMESTSSKFDHHLAALHVQAKKNQVHVYHLLLAGLRSKGYLPTHQELLAYSLDPERAQKTLAVIYRSAYYEAIADIGLAAFKISTSEIEAQKKALKTGGALRGKQKQLDKQQLHKKIAATEAVLISEGVQRRSLNKKIAGRLCLRTDYVRKARNEISKRLRLEAS